MLNVLQVFKIMFNAVKHFNFLSTFQWVKCKKRKRGAVKVVLLCVIVTETEMLGAPALTKLYSGIQCYIYTKVKGLCVNTC